CKRRWSGLVATSRESIPPRARPATSGARVEFDVGSRSTGREVDELARFGPEKQIAVHVWMSVQPARPIYCCMPPVRCLRVVIRPRFTFDSEWNVISEKERWASRCQKCQREMGNILLLWWSFPRTN